MPFDYENNLTAVYNALSQYNTTTAAVDLSSGLTSRVKSILKSDPTINPPTSLMLPAVYVMISSKEEEFGGIGLTGPSGARKFANVIYHIFAVYMKDGATDPLGTILTETYRLAENVEGVFQAEMKLSNTALWCNPTKTNFTPSFPNNGSLIKGFLTELEAKYHFR